jgi:hypothetical protein
MHLLDTEYKISLYGLAVTDQKDTRVGRIQNLIRLLPGQGSKIPTEIYKQIRVTCDHTDLSDKRKQVQHDVSGNCYRATDATSGHPMTYRAGPIRRL